MKENKNRSFSVKRKHCSMTLFLILFIYTSILSSINTENKESSMLITKSNLKTEKKKKSEDLQLKNIERDLKEDKDPEYLKAKLKELQALDGGEGDVNLNDDELFGNKTLIEEEPKEKKEKLNLGFISNLEIRYLLDVINKSDVFNKLFPKAKSIIKQKTSLEFDYKYANVKEFEFNNKRIEFFRDQDGILGAMGTSDILNLNKNKSNSLLNLTSIWLVSNSKVLVAYQHRSSKTIIFHIKKTQLYSFEVYSSPCLIVFNKVVFKKAIQSYLICFNSIEDRSIWYKIISNTDRN